MRTLESVDGLEIQVLVDNVTDSLSSAPRFVTNEWPALFKAGLRRIDGACLCCANHGLSLIITARRGTTKRTVLFDGGPAEYALEQNGRRLGIDFGSIEAVVLSHGHFDHAGGLPKAFDLIAEANGGRSVPLYLHPGMFGERAVPLGGGFQLPMKNILTPAGFAAHGADPIVTTEPQVLLDGMFWVSGEISRVVPYEVGLPGHVQRGEDGSWQPDPFIRDERFLAVDLKDKGLFVFSACSHAGIINVLTQARTSFPNNRIFAAMGGFHLVGINENLIPETVRDIATFDLRLISPGHCTGWRAVNALHNAFGGNVVVPYAVGKAFEL